jgi:tetratricopeptide (TPR) repeat protein/tRNA A-37 threonylcarbamoyl transferase component Bud32
MAIKCPKCHAENPDTLKFCGECGTQLIRGHKPDSAESAAVSPYSKTETLQSAVRELTTGSTFAGRYQIIEELGKGGMGRVYKVYDTEIKEKIGLKLLRPEIGIDEETVDRFRNELKLARRISQRNVCRMHDLNSGEGAYYITMEYVPGEDLKRLIRKVGQMPAGRTIAIARQVCEGLAEAHSLGIVHRDLKPQNIMVDEAGNAKIMDFGIARSLVSKGITGPGVIVGTPEYMSPEQVEGKEVDERSDIYSLGVILFEMVTGRVPFEGDTPFTIGVKHKSEAPRDPRELNAQIPADLGRLILRCLAKEKEQRYQNTGEILADLDQIEKGLPTTERIKPERRPLTSREITVKFSLKRLFIPAALILLVAIASIVIWQLKPRQKPAPPPLSAKPSLAVMYFENRTSEQDLDKILVDLLTTNLSRDERLEVVSSQRLFDILNEMGEPPGTSIDRSLATQIATRAGARTMLMGSIIKIGEKIRITSQLSNVGDAALIASEQADGNKAEDVFRMVDELSEKVIARLGLSGAEAGLPSIADVTTSSYEAYRYYQNGREHLWRWRFEEAAQNFEKAVELDPTFASAYSQLAVSRSNWGLSVLNPGSDITAVKETMNLAKKYANKATEKERLSIDLLSSFMDGDMPLYAEIAEKLVEKFPQDKNGYISLARAALFKQDLERAKELFEKALEIDPTDGNCYNLLAYTLSEMKDYPRALSTVKKYIAVHPDSWNSYDSAWEISVEAGLYDEGFSFLEEAKRRFPEDHSWHAYAAETYLLKGEAERAREEFRRYEALDPSAAVSQARNAAYSYLLEGRYAEAEAELRNAVENARQRNQGELYSRLQLGKIQVLLGKFDEGIRTYEEAIALSSKSYKADFNPIQVMGISLIGTALAAKGDIRGAQSRADELGRILKSGKYRQAHRDYLHYLAAEILITRKEIQAAQKEIESVSSWAKSRSPVYRKLEAEILALQGDFDQAIETYEQSFTRGIGLAGTGASDSFFLFLGRSLVDFKIAKIHEQIGDKIKARERYQKFLDLMKNADPGLPEVEEAKKRLAGLKG